MIDKLQLALLLASKTLDVVAEERLYNNGTVQQQTEWMFESLPLPPIQPDSKLVVDALIDVQNGAVGFDNIKISTKQRQIQN